MASGLSTHRGSFRSLLLPLGLEPEYREVGVDWQSVAIGGMFVVLGWVVALLLRIHDRVRDLHVWHDHKDEDGVFSWYVRKSLEDKIGELAKSIALLARTVQRMADREENHGR